MAENVQRINGIIGATGSGKSTIVSMIQDAPITFKKIKGAKYVIEHADITGKYPKIGH
jgi:ABC-type dipeptide/oligopeptide/nickel transport system ATPase component